MRKAVEPDKQGLARVRGDNPAAAGTPDFLCVCVRVPKSGSLSLSHLLKFAFAARQTFYLPDTLDFDGRISIYQRLRFLRSRTKNLLKRYGYADIHTACAAITTRAADGDLIDGGHIDFAYVRANIPRKVKIITILRHPVDRCRSNYNYARQVFMSRGPLRRHTAALLPKIAGRYDFDGFLDFLLDHRAVYGNVACQFIGWDPREDLGSFFASNVFYCGILEESERFGRQLAEKIGTLLPFPHENRTGQPVAKCVGARQRSKIEKIFEHDFVLYEWQRTHL